MPVKNAAPFLKECLDSILDQTFPKWELIVIDDHSTDQSRAILESYAQKDPRIRLETNPTNGIISAFKFAFKLSSGAYISRMDGDDKMPPDKLENLIELIRERVVVTGRVEYFSDQKISDGYIRYQNWLNQLTADDYEKKCYRECTIASPNWLVSRSFFENEFDWNSWSYPEDYDMVFQWLRHQYTVAKAESVTHLWREHPNRTSRNSERYQQAAFFELKTKWFVTNQLSEGEVVQLIGTERKAKLVRANLQRLGVDYRQFSFEGNSNYYKINDLSTKFKTILTNWPQDTRKQQEIQQFLLNKAFIEGENYWIF